MAAAISIRLVARFRWWWRAVLPVGAILYAIHPSLGERCVPWIVRKSVRIDMEPKP